MRPEDSLRNELIVALAPHIAVECIETGAQNPGFNDVLLAVPGADGLYPTELKVGRLVDKDSVVEIDYRAAQNAKQAELRRRIRCVWTLVQVPEVSTFFLVRDYRASWPLRELSVRAIWSGTILTGLKAFLMDAEWESGKEPR